MKVGDQIAYCPIHTEGRLNHKDTEYGFITEVRVEQALVFCRFFKSHFVITNDETGEGHHDVSSYVLRTTANSESVPLNRIIRVNHRDQGWIEDWLIDNGYRGIEASEKKNAERENQGGGA